MAKSRYRPATDEELAAEQLPPDLQETEASWDRSVEAALTATRIPAGWGPAQDPEQAPVEVARTG
jgi:hypothetical protein